MARMWEVIDPRGFRRWLLNDRKEAELVAHAANYAFKQADHSTYMAALYREDPEYTGVYRISHVKVPDGTEPKKPWI